MIIDGKIKLKSGTPIEHFTKDGLKFADGSELKADVVIFATGLVEVVMHECVRIDLSFWSRFGDTRESIAKLSGKEIAAKVTPIWNLNEEGELRGVAREIGLPNLWYMMGK